MTTGLPSSAAALQAQIAEVLGEPADSFGPDDDLLDVGLDSIRLMTLVERWRAGGLRVGFIDLAEQPTVNGWWSLMTSQKEDLIR
ncbi:phosphopantetheine-binding protein [Actinoplanes sp. NPDC051346]|uniref:phosphopantetheine-binding protein n=1 Tax=Actinoplanes sp. NPDC051346 TaxID=3155048 RepID=UPI003447991C